MRRRLQKHSESVYDNPIRIMLTGGGSGGPTQPLIALAEEIRKQKIGSKFIFLGSKNGPEKKMVEKSKIPFVTIPSGKLRRYWSWKNFFDPLLIILGGIVGFFHLLNFRPQVVISAGSFVSVPVAYSAWILKSPHIIFQMDLRPGLANLLMAPVSKALVYYFESSANHFPSIPVKRKIGSVVRDEIYNSNAKRANKIFGLNPKKPLILITGGGQGSAGLNLAISSILKHWLLDFQVVHLTGPAEVNDTTTDNSNFSHSDYHKIEVVHEGMGDLIKRSDIVLSRAGMGILSELSVLKKDSILIPLPKTHQEENAKFIHSKNATNFVSQKNLRLQGVGWWDLYLKQRIPGEKGKELNNLFSKEGKKEFAKVVFEIISKS